jgi:HK97 family phage prohead protease
MNKQYTQAIMKREGDKIVFIASDETLDRQGEVVSFDSWDLTNFKKNPVLLVDHDYKVENIVGTARNLKKDGGLRALTFEPKFHEITPLSQYVKQMVDEGSLSKVSVGFMSRGPMKDGGITINELLEISFVAVPANPNAGMMLSADQLACVKSFVAESVEEKDGRVLSKKSRNLMISAVGDIQKAVSTLGTLLESDSKAEVGDTCEMDNGDMGQMQMDGDQMVCKPKASKMIKTMDELKAKLAENPETVEVSPEIINELVEDSEKLSTLTETPSETPPKVDEPVTPQLSVPPTEDETGKEALKSIARAVNDTLRKMNKKF